MSETEPKKASGGVSLWLALSLGVNALLVGLVGGKVFAERDDHHRDRKDRPEHHRSMQIDDVLTKEQRKALRRQMVSEWRDSKDERTAHHQALQNVLSLAESEDFDKAALLEALSRLRETEDGLRRRTHEVIVNHLATVSPEQRKLLLRQLIGFKLGGDGRSRRFDRNGPGPDGPPPLGAPPPGALGPPPMEEPPPLD